MIYKFYGSGKLGGPFREGKFFVWPCSLLPIALLIYLFILIILIIIPRCACMKQGNSCVCLLPLYTVNFRIWRSFVLTHNYAYTTMWFVTFVDQYFTIWLLESISALVGHMQSACHKSNVYTNCVGYMPSVRHYLMLSYIILLHSPPR